MGKSVLWYIDNKVANLFDSRSLMSASGGKRCPFFGTAFVRTFSEQFGRLFLLKTPLTLWTLHSTLKVTYFAHFPLLHWWNDFLLWIILFKLSKTKSLEIMFSQFKTTSISKTTSKIKGWDFFFMLLKLRKVQISVKIELKQSDYSLLFWKFQETLELDFIRSWNSYNYP